MPHPDLPERPGPAATVRTVPVPAPARRPSVTEGPSVGCPPSAGAGGTGGEGPWRCAPTVDTAGGGPVPTYSHAGPPQETEVPPVVVRPGSSGGGPSATLDPGQASCMLATAALEVLAGRRQLAQLARWVTPGVYDDLARQTEQRAADGAGPPDTGGAEGPPGPVALPRVRRFRAYPVGRDAVEAAITVAYGGRVRAVAVRLARRHDRWRATALVVG